jgi:hypothetical protein
MVKQCVGEITSLQQIDLPVAAKAALWHVLNMQSAAVSQHTTPSLLVSEL